MIHGCFYHDKDVSLLSAIMENCSTLDQSREKDRVHLYCNDTLTGLTVGNNGNRSLFSSHTGVCGGALCECIKAATSFLSGKEESGLDLYVENNKLYLMERLSAPFLLILMEGNESIIISSYGAEDFDCKRIEVDTLSIRDSFAFPSPSPSPSLTRWVSLEREGDEQLADDLTSELRQKLNHFPQFNRAETRGVTLFKRAGQGHFHLSCHSVVEQSKAGPKGPVNQFNFFSIEARKLLREQNKEKEVSNNDWNKMVGKRWREMSVEEQAPFKLKAEQDKKRYEEECAVAGISFDKRVRHTAYNLFVHQEKQFVSGTGVSNIKAKTGRHCSLRWRNMKPEEKKLYEALEEAGHAK
mmetsp:Transcript_8791/g.19291  ORF Transcript_8791/g.19291 Transcript_8791/m.19291 type:complete len:354 (-) Transcript_8791:144-1205(-)|eukprot:CAMPEP_0173179496 /NCGR_PEP_ID=MMETSP1141-20130122/6154_1 /TAXON_ID=483371 /ORGANISM="non described non described, Strain CCMP2298" /LENGTH=353 /DNA_ID=CAMNT_0014102165 /DNA_START=136 /DNA_END=1197 /DNA_ORIENTATION=+